MGEVHDGWSPGEGYAAWSDAQLVEAVGAADRGALHELFARHEPWLATPAPGLAPDREEGVLHGSVDERRVGAPP